MLPLHQFIKFCLVGVINTLVCLVTIFLCKSLFGVNPYISNAIGYIAGVINSFLWNRRWVFHSHGRYITEALRFVIGFAVCYTVQLVLVYLLNQSSFGEYELHLFGFVMSGYGIATIIGNVVYTLCYFIYNRIIVFK